MPSANAVKKAFFKQDRHAYPVSEDVSPCTVSYVCTLCLVPYSYCITLSVLPKLDGNWSLSGRGGQQARDVPRCTTVSWEDRNLEERD